MCIEIITIRYVGTKRRQSKKLSQVVNVSMDSICSSFGFSIPVDLGKRRCAVDWLGYFFLFQFSVGMVCYERQRHAEDAHGNMLFSSRIVGNI